MLGVCISSDVCYFFMDLPLHFAMMAQCVSFLSFSRNCIFLEVFVFKIIFLKKLWTNFFQTCTAVSSCNLRQFCVFILVFEDWNTFNHDFFKPTPLIFPVSHSECQVLFIIFNRLMLCSREYTKLFIMKFYLLCPILKALFVLWFFKYGLK